MSRGKGKDRGARRKEVRLGKVKASGKRQAAPALESRARKKGGTFPEFEGTAMMNRDGRIYVKVEGMTDDIAVRSRTMGALNGDRVRVVMKRAGFKGKQAEGEIISIIERSKKPFVGVLHVVGVQAWVLMQSKNMPYDIVVPVVDVDGTPLYRFRSRQFTDQQEYTGALRRFPGKEYTIAGVYETVDGKPSELKVQPGMKVACVVDAWDRGETNPRGHICDVLGEIGDNETEMHAILAEYGLPYRFQSEVENAADKISDKIGPKELEGRRDFRKVLTFTIDPADAKDFDDAISFRPLDNGNYEVGVHIADVSYYVKPGSPVDKEAQERGTSVYLVDRTVPMLPEKLSNKLCSLRPGEDKLTFSAVFEITPKGKVFNQWFGRTVMNSDWRFAYETAQQIIDAGPEALEKEILGGTDGVGNDTDNFGVTTGKAIPKPLKEAILTLWGLAAILRKQRFAAGAISFERPEMKVEVDEKGKPIAVHQKVSAEANWLIEEFMLLANRNVAEFVATGGKMNGREKKDAKTFVYRIHDEPNMDKLQGLRDFAGTFGYKTEVGTGGDTAKQLNKLLSEAKDKPEFMALEMIALRSMAKACYRTDNIGHYGLAFRFYTHFTSPIRRYPDLMVHRLLAMYLADKPSQDKNYYEEQCVHASDREVLAANAERDSIKYKLVEYMEDKIGQEFDGHISGLTDWGMYVEIEPTKIEGMVALREIEDDFYEFDEEHYQVNGKRTGRVFRLGDPVRIRVKATSLEQRILDFELLCEPAPARTHDRFAGHFPEQFSGRFPDRSTPRKDSKRPAKGRR